MSTLWGSPASRSARNSSPPSRRSGPPRVAEGRGANPGRRGATHAHRKDTSIAGRKAGVIAALAVQDGNLDAVNPKTKQQVTAAELYRYAKDELHLDYLFWGTQEPHYTKQVLPLLRGLEEKQAKNR